MKKHIYNKQFEKFINTFFENSYIKSILEKLGLIILDFMHKRSIVGNIGGESGPPFDFVSNRIWNDEQLHQEDRKRVLNNIHRMFIGETDIFEEVYRIKLNSGRLAWLSSKGGVILRDSKKNPLLYIGVIHDITRIKEAQEEASRRAHETATLNRTIEVITSSLNLDETVSRILDQAKLVIPYSKASVQVLHEGYLEVLGGNGFKDNEKIKNLRFPYPEEGSLSTKIIQERKPILSNDVSKDFPKFIHPEPENKTRSWLGVPLIAHGDVIGILSFDASEKNYYSYRHLELARVFGGHVAIALENARMHEETYQLAMTDFLTGLGSRYSFDLNSRYIFEKSVRERRFVSVAMMDIDYFKKVNDTYGHQKGDVVLKIIAKIFNENIRSTDIVARYGGEEIVVLFPETEKETAKEISERIRVKVSETQFPGIPSKITISGGVSGYIPGKKDSIQKLIREADTALYKAKSKGRNQVVTY